MATIDTLNQMRDSAQGLAADTDAAKAKLQELRDQITAAAEEEAAYREEIEKGWDAEEIRLQATLAIAQEARDQAKAARDAAETLALQSEIARQKGASLAEQLIATGNESLAVAGSVTAVEIKIIKSREAAKELKKASDETVPVVAEISDAAAEAKSQITSAHSGAQQLSGLIAEIEAGVAVARAEQDAYEREMQAGWTQVEIDLLAEKTLAEESAAAAKAARDAALQARIDMVLGRDTAKETAEAAMRAQAAVETMAGTTTAVVAHLTGGVATALEGWQKKLLAAIKTAKEGATEIELSAAGAAETIERKMQGVIDPTLKILRYAQGDGRSEESVRRPGFALERAGSADGADVDTSRGLREVSVPQMSIQALTTEVVAELRRQAARVGKKA
jgi:trimeric autotransporter adhesin